MRFWLSIVILGGLFSASVLAQDLSFVPLPASIQQKDGRFALKDGMGISAAAALKSEANWLSARLSIGSGMKFSVQASGGVIRLSIDASLPQEGYELEISPAEVTIRGGSNAGVFYGAVTFLQSLPSAVFGREVQAQVDWSAPALQIKDAPLCTWRGLHLDSSRHFQPKDFLLKFLDAMAAQKLNRLHWHLVDSEAWRLEIRKYPKLTQVHRDFPAYYPEEIPTNPTFRAKYRYGHFHGGGHYSQADVREIVAYAQKLHITIVPEIEFPGHAMAALTAYPELGATRKVPVVRSNITPDLFGVHPRAMTFLMDVLDETMELFPSPWIHFGGDEAPKGQWKNDAYTQKRIDELGLRINDPEHPNASEDAMQAWMFNELAAHIAKKKRRAVGWEEIMHGKNLDRLPKGSVIMPWLSVANGAVAANAGYGVVHTAVGPFYLDSYQVQSPNEPSALYGGPFTLEQIHRFQLFPDNLTESGRANIFGAQCQLWTELMPRTDDVEYQAYPRACALAELTWTAPERRVDTDDFLERLVRHGARLTALGLNHRRVSPKASLQWSPEFLSSGATWELAAAVTATAEKPVVLLNFLYREGTHGLDIQGAELLDNGQVLVSDKHEGFTGGQPRANQYRMKVPAAHLGKNLTLRILAMGAGGNDSRGDVSLSTVAE